MVVDQLQAVGLLHGFGEPCIAIAEHGPRRLLQNRTRRKRQFLVGMNGVGGLGSDQDLTTHILQERRMTLGGFQLGIDIARQQLGRVPAADKAVPKGFQDRPQFVGGARKLVAKLHAGEPGRTCLLEAGFQRNVAADFQHVIIGPADWVRPDTDHSCFPLVIIGVGV